jgi:hypothetical protein
LTINREQVQELLYQALETEQGGQQVYKHAIKCAVNDELREEWEKYLGETEEHEQILLGVFETFGFDPRATSPGREIVRYKAQGLVTAMTMALTRGKSEASQLVAAECVVEAETKDHQNWQLIGRVAEAMSGKEARALKEAHAQVEDQEDEHLYHTMGYARELWIESLGMPSVLPPPEEQKHVKSQIGAARAQQGRKELLPAKR